MLMMSGMLLGLLHWKRKKSILSWSHTKVRDSNSDLQQMYAIFLFLISVSLLSSLSLSLFGTWTNEKRDRISFVWNLLTNRHSIRTCETKKIKLRFVSWTCKLINFFGLSSSVVITYQLEYETKLPLWCFQLTRC